MSDEQPVPETLESIAASIRELRTSMESRFGEVDTRFDKIDGRFTEVDTRFDKIDGRFTEVDTRFDKIDGRFTEVDTRFDKIDGRFTEVDNRFAEADTRFGKIDSRFDKIDTRFDEMKAQLRTEIESVRGDVRLVAEGLAAQTILLQRVDKDHQRLEERVDKHEVRIFALEPETPA